MLSPRRSIRLRGAGRRLVLLLVLLTSALAWPQTPAPVRAAGPPSVPAAGDLPTFIVTWSITASERYLSSPSGVIWSTSITGHAMAVATLESNTDFGVNVPTLSVLGEHQLDS